MSNPWTLNLENIVVSNVFFEPMLVREVSKAYDSPSLVIKTVEGHVLLDISHKAIVECFGLDRSASKASIGKI